MNAMTMPYRAMASTSAKPIHMYLPTAAFRFRLTGDHLNHLPEDVSDPYTGSRKSGCGQAHTQSMLLLLNPLLVNLLMKTHTIPLSSRADTA